MGAAAGINFLLTAAFAPHIPAELVFYRRILIGAYKNILWAPISGSKISEFWFCFVAANKDPKCGHILPAASSRHKQVING